MISPSIQAVFPRQSFTWALHTKATTMGDPDPLIHTLTGAILASGGWILSRGADDNGTINMLFEFERMHCVDIYTVLIAVGLELSQLAHLRFTELCQCTKSHHDDCGGEIVSVDLEIHTFNPEQLPSLGTIRT